MGVGWPTVLAVVAVGLSGCGSGSGSSPSTSPSPSTATVTTFGGLVGSASTAACREDVRASQQASDLWGATHDAPAPSIGALVDAGLLRAAPSTGHGYEVRYDPATGRVSAVGACRSAAG